MVRELSRSPRETAAIDRSRVGSRERTLERFDNKRSMNLEQLDGFFAALISGPQIVPPSDYLSVICGDEMVLRDTVNAQPMLQEFLSLIMSHWMLLPILCIPARCFCRCF